MADPTNAQMDTAEAGFKAEVYQAADSDQSAAQQMVAQQEKAGQQQIDLAERFAASQQPFTQEPPHEQIQQVMNGAPWLFALTAIGGKLSGLNGQAMLQGLNGVSDGLIKGDEEAMANNYKNYETNYEKWKANTDQQYKIYSELSRAYGNANDGNLRALQAALSITHDSTQMKLSVDDPTKYWEVKSKLEEAHAKTAETYAKIKAQSSFSDPGVKQLQAALAEKGVSLPAGLRSKQQQLSVLQGLVDKHPGETADQIAELVKQGKIDLAAETKEVQTAAAVSGRVEVASNELKQFVPLAMKASAAVPRGSFLPINKLLQSSETQLQNPNLSELKIYVNSILNAYDMLAARGGTDVKKREEAHALLTSAQSPEVFQRNLQAFLREADAAGIAAQNAMKSGDGKGGGAAPRTVVAVGTSQSDGKTYVKYSDGTIGPIGAQ